MSPRPSVSSSQLPSKPQKISPAFIPVSISTTMAMRTLCLSVFLLTAVALKLNTQSFTPRSAPLCSIFESAVTPQDGCSRNLRPFLRQEPLIMVEEKDRATPDILDEAYSALSVMQEEFFKSEVGTWPSAIDWTAAVLQTHVSGLTATLSQAFKDEDLATNQTKANMIDLYFSQTVASYFGQDHFAIRLQAHDDMLWVVLGWLEAIRFIARHSASHYDRPQVGAFAIPEINDALEQQPWYGNYWVRSFCSRARVFWELASNGWGTKLCGGGMNWSPHEKVYKNAITNELWIAASIQMYLNFPGDDISSPWIAARQIESRASKPERDAKFLKAAIEGYKWLMGSNMTNKAGLFVDGFHISGRNGSTKCDQRNEMVYTYNQGVLLTGQRGLWVATGSASYLEDGHELIQNVIRATGWSIIHNRPEEAINLASHELPRWRGLGRSGIMEEICDSTAKCSQNGHTFKGIFFHHLTYFCQPLRLAEMATDGIVKADMFEDVAREHVRACKQYVPWLKHNAKAAMRTRNQKGVFGTWWTVGLQEGVEGFVDVGMTKDMVDYRNFGVRREGVWGNGSVLMVLPGIETDEHDESIHEVDGLIDEDEADQAVMDGQSIKKRWPHHDLNDRGRGRTVETQNGGLAVLRAYWEVSQL